ncbi:hydroxymethylglutaryl-CoA lyase [Ottowia thiooxydans]|uniref:Hydroxymethylglutaryl-CoA lyase n=1 Tax=Ottowia thiooxydans TaxID=219182 RepID=A0ABV2Q832_9BURK
MTNSYSSGPEVMVCEVGLRDGLQMFNALFPTAEKLAWIQAESAAGVREIEVTSFVPPKLVPQFVDAQEVVHGALAIPGLCVVALVPNLKGAERAIELGVHKLNYVMSVSRTHNLRNVRREREESLADFKRIADLIRALPEHRRPRLLGGLSSALGCGYEGRVPVADVQRWAVAYAEAGADEIMIADTVGYADPVHVKEAFRAVIADVGTLPVSAHFHDTRGLGLANVAAALECGVRRFDASLAGLGGCQFVPSATGNIVMDDLCFMLDAMGMRTGVDLEKLVAVREIVARNLPGTPLYGKLAGAGLPVNYHAGATAA